MVQSLLCRAKPLNTSTDLKASRHLGPILTSHLGPEHRGRKRPSPTHLEDRRIRVLPFGQAKGNQGRTEDRAVRRMHYPMQGTLRRGVPEAPSSPGCIRSEKPTQTNPGRRASCFLRRPTKPRLNRPVMMLLHESCRH